METIYTDSVKKFEGGPSIFLAGPTPRDSLTPSWRPEALEYLQKSRDALALGNIGLKDLTILVPERSDWASKFSHSDQIEWELNALSKCTAIVFWVPRQLDVMPAFTTNVEFGYWMAKEPSKVFYGRPDNSPKNDYLDYIYTKISGKKPYKTLNGVLAGATYYTYLGSILF